jgi:hypothetical protein
LRTRFELPVECDPVVSAIRKPRNKIRVFITCGPEPRRRLSAPRSNPSH